MTQIDGQWTIEANSPVGKQTVVLDITTDGTTANGTLTGPDGLVVPIEDATVDGAKVGFKIRMTTPVAMSLAFTLTFDSDELTGKVKAGLFPATKATGQRVKTA